MSSDPVPEPGGDLDGYLQRAELLAELGRYDEAAAELGFARSLAPQDPRGPALLARIHLAAGRPAEALTAAESGLAAALASPAGNDGIDAGGTGTDVVGTGAGAGGASGGGAAGPRTDLLLRAEVMRGFALADLRRFGEAAEVAARILAAAPADAYAQRNGAAILAESRNGQPALNAAWRGVELAPHEPQAHLVLSLVAARLGLFELAERAYREALARDPELTEAAHDVGVIRLERRRYAVALAEVAESAIPATRRPDLERPDRAAPADAIRPDGYAPEPNAPGASAPNPDAPNPDVPGGSVPGGSGWAGTAPRSTPPPGTGSGPGRPPGMPPTPAELADGFRRLILYGAGYAVVAAVLVACLAGGNPGLSRLVAAGAALGGFAVLWTLAARTPGLLRTVLPELLRRDRALAFAGYAALAGPALILLYALVGTPWPLVLAIAATALAQLVVLRRPLPPPR